MKKQRLSGILHFGLLAGLCLLLTVLITTKKTYASFNNRTITINTGLPGSAAAHTFSYDTVTPYSIGSIKFDYCSNNPIIDSPCVTPVGLDTSGAVLSSQVGDTGFSVHPNTLLSTNSIILTRATSPSTPGFNQYAFSNITNPSTVGSTYVRISIYATTDATGPYQEWGGLVFATNNPLQINAFVPPFITLCHGATVAVNCSSVGSALVRLGELSSSATTTATTQFAVATNSGNGYAANIIGSTLTAGNRTVTPLTTPSGSLVGREQFGVNLRANTIPGVGDDVVGVGSAIPAAGYNSANVFGFNSGDILAYSTLPSDWNRFTLAYIVNIPNNQPPGSYASTITVVASTTF